ncbi:hypothetical protein F4861DRAFT_527010 [Xylaria intraflava]|nr:hypothetical protein F4861DRAFT_527010 [Xylaria intraflava]
MSTMLAILVCPGVSRCVPYILPLPITTPPISLWSQMPISSPIFLLSLTPPLTSFYHCATSSSSPVRVLDCKDCRQFVSPVSPTKWSGICGVYILLRLQDRILSRLQATTPHHT